MIELHQLRKTYAGGVVALDGVDLTVAAGEVFGVVGRSGAGKSTLLRTVNLLERPDSGTVRVAGQDLTALPAARLRAARHRIGMIFQHFNLLRGRTVAANVALPLTLAGVARAQRRGRVAELLDLVGLADKATEYPARLSGGQRQRVAIARALATRPDVLLSDEATSALDPYTTVEVLDLLRDLNQRLGLTVLLITHDLGVVDRICDRVGVLSEGRLLEAGPVADLAANPASALSKLREAVR
ncbi:D-methionine transport system ATP-binding protein [Hamadaea flava]|uniref:Methionine ABC transporter ATP-binding protein n=1 Tax=Hamadaea flava TaxID=1742688 RepID=A0ABV8LZ19_9ACTN|nr:ATP-binding cassette domain-containing protein [Hamadaea flava]MCP2321707.1 D-methionine transport system ATP-binding protein [Hamadaea flava]